MAKVKIEGLEDCLRCMDAAPGNVRKITKTALREAAKVTRKQIKMATPKRYQRLAGFKLKTVSGEQSLWIGLFNRDGKRSPGSPPADWFKAYWKNYGTLKHRDPSHKFRDPIRMNRKKKNWEGQPHENFFEGAIAGWEGPFIHAFESALAEQQEKLYDR